MMFLVKEKKALKTLFRCKRANGGQTNEIVAAHRPCEPLLFRSKGKCSDFRQARNRDLSKPRAETIEPALDADGGEGKIASRSVVNTFDSDIPRGNAGSCERPFPPQPPWLSEFAKQYPIQSGLAAGGSD
jgi:hypothetical protein